MKKVLKVRSALIILAVLNNSLWAQYSRKDVFTSPEIVWYGLDFSKAKFIGTFAEINQFHHADEYEMVHRYIPAWNILVVDQPHFFPLKSTFEKNRVYHDLKPVEAVNKSINPESLMCWNSYSIGREQLAPVISSYGAGDKKEGIGLVFIVESFNKPERTGNFWVVFFDIKTRNILLSEHCSGRPVGFGLRNYWAGSLKHILSGIRHCRWNEWKQSAYASETVVRQ